MQTQHVFSRVCEHAKWKEIENLRAQTKEVVVNVYEYFEELGRRKQTEGSLKRTSDANSDQSDSADDD